MGRVGLRLWVITALGALTGCTRAGFGSPERPARDVLAADRGSGERPALPDARRDAILPDTHPLFDPLAPFGAPQPVQALNTSGEEDDPTLTGDMLEILFDRDGDIWRASRPSLSASWSAPQPVAELNSTSVDTAPKIAPDGLTVFFASDRFHPLAKGGVDIYVATRAQRGAPWTAPQPVAELNSTADEGSAAAPPSLLTIVFATTRSVGVGHDDLYFATRSATSAAWSAPQAVPGVNTTSLEADPWIDPTFTLIYFSTDRAGGAGQRDIWMARRGSTTDPFQVVGPVGGIGSTAIDADAWLSFDLRTVYFSSNRQGTSDLFVATR